MLNYDSNYRINNKFDMLEDGRIAVKGAINDYCERIELYKKTADDVTVFEIDENKKTSGIRVAFKDKQNASHVFLSNILEFLCLPDYLLHKDNRVRTEYVSEVLNARYIELSNAIIDQNLILLIQRYFTNIKEIFLNNCIIKSNCCFNNNYQIISFNRCIFDSLACVNDLDAYNVSFSSCVFNGAGNPTLNVKRLSINGNDDSEYENIFLRCYFPKLDILNLKGLCILDKSLMFIPYSCPNIYKLNIETYGIKDVSYLYNVSNLLDCNISTFDSLDGVKIGKDILSYSQDDLDIYLNKKIPIMIYKSDGSVDDEYYYMYNDVMNCISKEIMHEGDKLYTWKHLSWIEEIPGNGVRRKISPVINAKPSIVHPSGKVLFFSINPYNYSGSPERTSEIR